MSALVRLHRDPISSGAHILRLPPWVPPIPSRTGATGRYWHQPRSGALRADGHIILDLWCGQMRHLASLDHLTGVPPADLQCGTCVGRRAGYDRSGGLIFRPRDAWAPPRVCPCSTPDPADHRLCAACGRRTNAARGWNVYGLARHAPGEAFLERWRPCPLHGWSRADWREGRIVCGHFGCPAS